MYGFVRPGLNGANAEYVCLPSADVLLKPPTLSSEEMAAVPVAAITALQFLHAANLKAGQKILINGASGGLGTFAVQIAKSFGAEVTGVCSTSNLALVQSLGADKVIDYRHEDFTQSGQQYHAVFDAVGKSSFSKCRNILEQHGVYISTILTVRILFQMLFTMFIGKKQAKFLVSKIIPEDFMTIHTLFSIKTTWPLQTIKVYTFRRGKMTTQSVCSIFKVHG